MFYADQTEPGNAYRRPTAALLVFNVAAMLIALWVMVDLLREQETMRSLIKQLPESGAQSAQDLASELLWQFRMSVLLLINLITTAIGVVLLWRAHHVSVESLLDFRAQANDILGSMDQAVITSDLQGHITSMNRVGMQLFPVNDGGIGMKLADVVPGVSIEALKRDCDQTNGSLPWRDFTIQRAGGDLRLRINCEPLQNRASKTIGYVLQIRDVTEVVLVEERMRRMERYMGLGDLLAGLYHEIKNPLAALSIHVQLLSERLEALRLDGESSEMLEVIENELARVNGVLESFRDFASIGQLTKTPVDLRQLIARQVKLISPQAVQNNIAVELDLGSQSSNLVSVDEMKIEQVFLNLLTNAMDAMPNGGKLTIRLTEQTDSTAIELEDSGHGIPESIRHRIFDPYFTTKSQGIGMGLALCEKLVRQHDGTLTYRPRQQGSLFRLVLPLSPSLLTSHLQQRYE